MAIFAADNTSGGETQHPERFFTLMAANLTEKGQLLCRNLIDYRCDTGYDWGLRFAYSRDGLYVSGWKLVDANGVEIDPRPRPIRSSPSEQRRPSP